MLTALGLALAAALSLPWVLAHVGLASWIRRMCLAAPRGEPESVDVQVVMPARNEAPGISESVDALLGLPGSVDVVVVDDDSQDDTAERARVSGASRPGFRLMATPPRPAGWSGKAWACWTGHEGSSAWLAFVDADVILAPRALEALVAAAGPAGLISAFGTWRTPSPGTELLVPAVGWLVRGGIDPRRVALGRQAFANGQCLLIRRDLYEAIGGHGAVRGDVLDDVALARVVLAEGASIRVAWAPWAFEVRAYSDVAGLTAGYRKNLAAGLGGRGHVVVAALALAVFGPTPLVACLAAAAAGAPRIAIAFAIVVVLQVGLRIRLDRLDGRSPRLALLYPLATGWLAYLLAISARRTPVAWKGRTFAGGKVVDPRKPEP